MAEHRQTEPQNREKAETPVDVPSTLSYVSQHETADRLSVLNFRLVKQIGKGAYGTVWLAVEELTGVSRAVKIVRKAGPSGQGGATSGQSSSSNRELSGLREYSQRIQGHPHLLQILHVGETSEHFYYVMELADGVHGTGPEETDKYKPLTLSESMKRRGVSSPAHALEMCRQILVGLEHLHSQGLVHRDVKPANLVFVGGKVKLGDIGLVTRQDRDMTQVGTLGYMAPEGVFDAGTDLYAVGKILYELSTGLDRSRFPELPTGRLESLREQRTLAKVNRVFSKAAHPDRRQRYRSAADFIRAVDEAQKAISRPAVGSLWRATPKWLRITTHTTLLLAGSLAVAWAVHPGGGGPLPPPQVSVFEEDWEAGIDTRIWLPYGSPLPSLAPGQGDGGGTALAFPGSPNSASRISLQITNNPEEHGIVYSADLRIDRPWRATPWQILTMYLSKEPQDGKCLAGIQLVKDGDGVMRDKIVYFFSKNAYLPDDRLVTPLLAEDLGRFHAYTIRVNPNRTVTFLRDGRPMYTSQGRLEPADQLYLIFSGRCVGSATYCDDISVWPVPGEQD